MKRQSNGQFKYKPFKNSNFHGLALLIVIMAIGAYLNYRFEPVELHRPIVGEVKAVEMPVKPIVEAPKPKIMTIEDKIRAKFPEDPDYAVQIAKCESSMNPKAINTKNKNGSVDYGLFQINSVHGYTANYLLDADNNLKIARELYDRQGWRPWVCSWK